MTQSRYERAMSRRGFIERLLASTSSLALFGTVPRLPVTLRTNRGRGITVGPKWDDAFELAVDFQIAQPNEGRSHRPYVAIWMEDASGHAVRTLSLWVNTSGRGPRYIRELRKWFAASEGERSAGGPNLVGTVSSATRLPGKYTITWNGRDDQGRVLEQGSYRLCIEAAREHGPYHLIEKELTLTTTPVAAELPGSGDIASAHVEYRRRK